MEFNTGCPSGVVQIPKAINTWLETGWAKDILDGLALTPYPMLADEYAFARGLTELANCAEYPVQAAAIVNFRDVFTNEVEWIVRSFRELGLESQLCDARSIRERSGKIWCAGQEYQLVYNKMAHRELLADPATADYVQMFRHHGAYFVSSLFAQSITENKAFLALLSDPSYEALFDPAQRKVIDQHVPWTRVVEPRRTTGIEGTAVDLVEYVSRNRGRLVLKPTSSTRGERVVVGPFVSDYEWENTVGTALTSRFVAQEYVPLPVMSVPGASLGRVYVDLSFHVLAGRLIGFFSRCSPRPVVNMGAGGACVPVIGVNCGE